VTDRRASLLMWVGVWAAPVAWALQHAAGVLLGIAQCGPNGARWQIQLTTLNVVVAVVTFWSAPTALPRSIEARLTASAGAGAAAGGVAGCAAVALAAGGVAVGAAASSFLPQAARLRVAASAKASR